MRQRGWVVFAASAVALLSALPAFAQKAPDFTLNDLDGRSHKLAAYFPGHVVLINFWATWCVPCAKELPHLQRLQDAHGPNGLQVLTIDVDGPDRAAAVSAFIGRYGFTLPVLRDTESRVVAIYNPSLELPYTVILDRQGAVRLVHRGYSPGDERIFEAKVAALLAEPQVKPGSGIAAQVNESFLLRLPKKGSTGADADADYSEILDQLDATVSWGGLQAGARADADLDFSPFDPDFRLAKRYVQYSTEGLRARAGDFYASLGRGLVFSLVKVFEEEGLDYVIDTTVDGGSASLGSGPFTGEAFGGWIERAGTPGVRDKVLGGSAGWKKAGLGTLRVQAVTAALAPGSEFGNRRVDTGSMSLDLPDLWGAASFFGEFSLIRRQVYEDFAPGASPVNGHGLYLASKLHWRRMSLLVEMKDYRELNFEYSRPPLLESEELDILADQFDLDRTDVSGYSARLDYYAPASETLLYAKFLRIEDDPEDHFAYGAYDRGIGHVFGGLEKRFARDGYLNVLAGWRWEDDTSPAFLSTNGRTFHDQVNAVLPVGRGWSLEGDWKHKAFDGAAYDFSEIRSSLSVHRSPGWVFSLLYERTTDPVVILASGKKDYWAGQVEARFGRGHAVRLFVGSTKGSVKCAGGVCRLFPPFEGVRLEAFFRF